MKLLLIALILLSTSAQASWLDGQPDVPPTQLTGILPDPAVPTGVGDFTMLSRAAGDPEGEYESSRITDYVFIIRDENTGEEYLYFKVDGGQRIIVHREKGNKK